MKKLRGIFEAALRGMDRAFRLVSIIAVMVSVQMFSACSSSSTGQEDNEGEGYTQVLRGRFM